MWHDWLKNYRVREQTIKLRVVLQVSIISDSLAGRRRMSKSRQLRPLVRSMSENATQLAAIRRFPCRRQDTLLLTRILSGLSIASDRNRIGALLAAFLREFKRLGCCDFNMKPAADLQAVRHSGCGWRTVQSHHIEFLTRAAASYQFAMPDRSSHHYQLRNRCSRKLVQDECFSKPTRSS